MIDWEKASRYNESVSLSGEQLAKLTAVWQTLYAVEPVDGMCGPLTIASINSQPEGQLTSIAGKCRVIQVTESSFVVHVDDDTGELL